MPDSIYPMFDAGTREAKRAGLCALAVMAKAPRAGKVKTRLQPPLTADEAAGLNVCFLRDTAENIAGVAQEGGAIGLICYTPVGDESAFDGLLPAGFGLIAQRGDGFGERLHAAVEDLLSCGFGAVCLIDSDSPTLPAETLRTAVSELARAGDRVVIGGSEDGGYYLIGLKRAEPRVFERIAWSTASVYAETVERVREAGLEFVELPKWYDVDDAATLAVLERELLLNERPQFAVRGQLDTQIPLHPSEQARREPRFGNDSKKGKRSSCGSVEGFDARHTRAYLAERLRAREVNAEERT